MGTPLHSNPIALILAIGIVVDDAIVVVEAVHAKLEEGAESALKATHDAMGEITGAIISITLVMAAVFIPVTLFKDLQEYFTNSLVLPLWLPLLFQQ